MKKNIDIDIDIDMLNETVRAIWDHTYRFIFLYNYNITYFIINKLKLYLIFLLTIINTQIKHLMYVNNIFVNANIGFLFLQTNYHYLNKHGRNNYFFYISPLRILNFFIN